MSQSRQLAAIMFTDIAGYTALMEQDEQAAFALLLRNRELQKPIIEKFNGRWLKELGDGVLISFDTISEAVYAAGAIQKAARQISELNLRIGIHQGEVVFDGDDVFGSGVNIASRLETLAPVSDILVSDTVNKEVINKKGIRSEFIGERELRGVSEPLKVYQISVDCTEYPFLDKPVNQTNAAAKPVKKISQKIKIRVLSLIATLALVSILIYLFSTNYNETTTPSIAVLAFDDNPNEWNIGESFADQIINELAKIEGLKVIGKTSSFAYKGTSTDLVTIGKELDVNTILEGGIQIIGNKMRFIAQLIDASDGSHIWSDKYDIEFELSEILQVQDQLAQKISNSLLNSILESESGQKYVNEEAYKLYLMAKSRKPNQQGTESEESKVGFENNYLERIRLYKEAIKMDSSFVDAYVELAGTYSSIGFLFGEEWLDNVWALAEVTALEALQLDDNNSSALRTLAYVKRNKYWDWSGAQTLMRKSIDASPSDWRSYNEYAMLLSATNQHDSAIFCAKKAVDLNPISNVPKVSLVRTYYYDRRFHLALDESKNLNPLAGAEHAVFDIMLNRSNKQSERDQGVSRIITELSIDEDSTRYFELYRAEGWKSLMRALYKANYELSAGKYFIMIHGATKDEVFARLNQDADNRVGLLAYALVSPVFDPVRSDPRFEDLLNKMGLNRYK